MGGQEERLEKRTRKDLQGIEHELGCWDIKSASTFAWRVLGLNRIPWWLRVQAQKTHACGLNLGSDGY